MIDMDKRRFFLTMMVPFICIVASGQMTVSKAVKEMLKDQGKVYKSKSSPIRREYKTLTYNLAVVQKFLLAELLFLDSLKADNLDVNIFEGSNPTYGNIYGVLWWGDDYYEFALQNKMYVRKKKFDELSEDNKKVVSSYQDWNSSIFKFSDYDTSMRYRGDDVCQVYLASKFTVKPGNKVKSIGFYY